MAQRKLKGTYVRNSWDFYESGDAIGFCQTTAGAGAFNMGLLNNTTVQGNMDIYRADLNSQTPQNWFWFLAPPVVQATPLSTPFQLVKALQLDAAAPAGQWISPTGVGEFAWFGLWQRDEGVTYDTIELQSGGPFVTLPPGWALIIQATLAGAANIAMRAWWQIVSDQVAPAA